MQKTKKTAAALAAVFAFIRDQEDILAAGSVSGETVTPSREPAPPVSFSNWGMSGRRDMMQLRNLMQLRTFQKGGIR
jgi:hypothetical protein